MGPARKEPDLSTYSGRVAERIRHLRDKAELSVPELVARLKELGYALSVQGYYKWENGRAKLDLDAAPALAKAFGLKSTRGLFPPT